MPGIPTVATDLNTVLVIMEGNPNLYAYTYTNIESIEKNVKTQPQCLMATIMFQDPYLP